MDAREKIELFLTPGLSGPDWERLERAFEAKMRGETSRIDVARVLGRTHLPLFHAEIDEEQRAMTRTAARLVFRWEGDYPAALRAVAGAPPAIFVRGVLPGDDRPKVAIVGTRKPSAGASAFAFALARNLSLLGVVVVSGMARGIDTAAHHGTLDAGGITVAVLGTGVDVAYPRENAALMERIADSGAVVSEQRCGMRPYAGVFPRRNRIISGMSDAVVVVEGGAKSGALITARWALDQGREVGAVPGFPGGFRSEGPNRLLKEGAFVVEDAVDVVTHVPRIAESVQRAARLERPGRDAAAGLDEEAARVYDAVTNAASADEVALTAGMAVERAQSVLTMLEIDGRVRRDEIGRYTRLGRPPRR
jgi:DNA processing protein